MNKPDIFANVVKAYYHWHYDRDLDTHLSECIERLRKEGHIPPSVARVIHDHLELAANWKQYYGE